MRRNHENYYMHKNLIQRINLVGATSYTMAPWRPVKSNCDQTEGPNDTIKQCETEELKLKSSRQSEENYTVFTRISTRRKLVPQGRISKSTLYISWGAEQLDSQIYGGFKILQKLRTPIILTYVVLNAVNLPDLGTDDIVLGYIKRLR